MPLIKCCDCGKGRRYRGSVKPQRCLACAAERGRLLHAASRQAFKRRKICVACRREKVSANSAIYCDRCAGYHAGYQAFAMRVKRATAPEYREDERIKVKARMRKIRAERRKSGLTSNGQPLKSPTLQAVALRRFHAPA